MVEKYKKEMVYIPTTDRVFLEGVLKLPKNAKGVVLFAHGSGSGRHSPRNNFVAGVLREAEIGTLLFDLLTEEEDLDYQNRFNIELLTKRLIDAVKWLKKQPETKKMHLGFFGASTGAAAALKAGVILKSDVRAIVSRGGRPDLAMDTLDQVKSPTLLIVGGEDKQVLDLNRQAYDQLKVTKKLDIIPYATHLFEEAGALEKVANKARDWFRKYLYKKQIER